MYVPYNNKIVNALIKNRCKVSYANDFKSQILCTMTASVLEQSNLYSFLIVV